jgi:hypothetical protein
MSDYAARKRLKKKMLDRWENEGGRICSEPIKADERRLRNEPEGEVKEVSASHRKSKGGPSPSSTPSRKSTRK